MAALPHTVVIQGASFEASACAPSCTSALPQTVAPHTPGTLPADFDWLILGDWALKKVSDESDSFDTPVILVRPAMHVSGNITLTGVSDPDGCGCNVVLIG